ncbi:MAG: DUF3566 domain-containing protein [Mycobacterium sp.]
MTSPNEPGAPKQGDSLIGEGSVERTSAHRAPPAHGQDAGDHRAPPAHGQDAGDTPPWQRGAARASYGTRQHTEPHTEVRPAGPAGADARLNRFISGTATPAAGATALSKAAPQEFESAPAARGDSAPADAYASELPDLSGPIPRPSQRTAPPDRSSDASSAAGRSVTSEPRENRVQVSRRAQGPVRASMQIRRIDPWSTLKVSLTLSAALFFVWMVAVAFLYLVLGGMGVWAKLNSNVGDLLNNTSGSSGELVSSGTIFGGAVLIGLVNIVLLTAMATIGAFVYNLATDLIGGIEVTLADRD